MTHFLLALLGDPRGPSEESAGPGSLICRPRRPPSVRREPATRHSTCALLALTVALGTAPAAHAAAFNVAAGDVEGLAAAMDAANANGEPDTINLPAGTYTITARYGPQAGLPDVDSEIALIGAGAASTEITRATTAPFFRLLNVTENGRLRLEGLTLSRGDSSSTPGGALRSDGAVTVKDCAFRGNSSFLQPGGAIFSIAAPGSSGLTIESSQLTGNSGGGASAILAVGDLTLRGVQVTGNSDGYAGAVRWLGPTRAVIIDTLIQDNSGGGLELGDLFGTTGIAEVVRTTVDGNTNGAGMDLAGNDVQVFVTDSTISNNVPTGIRVSTKVTLRRVTVSGNGSAGGTFGFGGGIDVSPIFGGADLTIDSTTISGNSAPASGGGIYVRGPLPHGQRVRISRSTITGNTAGSNGTGSGGGIAAPADNVDLIDTIVAGNVDQSGAAPDCTGALLSQGHNLIGSTAGCAITTAAGDITGVAPLLGPLADNGGPTATHLPLAGSPALDAADPASCGVPDQRFRARTAACDIGAVEAAAASTAVFSSDAFLCQRGRTSKGSPALAALGGVLLADDVESKEFDVKKTSAVCTPSGRDGLGAADEATYLHGRAIKETVGQPRHVKQRGVVLVNELGRFVVDTVRPDSLLVPGSVGRDAFLPAPDPLAHDLDRFKCYLSKTSASAPPLPRRVAALRTALSNELSDARTYALNKVTRLCNAVDEQSQGRKHPNSWLVCLQAKLVKPSIRGEVDPTIRNLHVADEWGNERDDAKRAYEICVPSLRLP
ncbi:MAG: right-handed parallel beta-helix repeat-containing protein [Deltaproteobacteria bacterium]|nr:right-handed parallel beta-helix repeat-containing protein [Deltaproteobacteria bacterium]